MKNNNNWYKVFLSIVVTTCFCSLNAMQKSQKNAVSTQQKTPALPIPTIEDIENTAKNNDALELKTRLKSVLIDQNLKDATQRLKTEIHALNNQNLQLKNNLNKDSEKDIQDNIKTLILASDLLIDSVHDNNIKILKQ